MLYFRVCDMFYMIFTHYFNLMKILGMAHDMCSREVHGDIM